MSSEEKIISLLGMMQADIGTLKTDVGTLKGEILKTNMRIENEIVPKLQLLTEGHAMLAATLAPKNRVEQLEEDVAILKHAFSTIAAELSQLKKAQ